jgi:hypothetical protein
MEQEAFHLSDFAAKHAANLKKGIICKACGERFPRDSEERVGKHCSSACREETRGKLKKCKPACAVETLSSRVVKFGNGKLHRQEVCSKCFRTRYITFSVEDKVSRSAQASGPKLLAQSKALGEKFGDNFYTSTAWLRLRYMAFQRYGRKCVACGTKEGAMHVDHIKPRSRFPELALDFSNLQVLCKACNLGKSNKFEDDFRRNQL